LGATGIKAAHKYVGEIDPRWSATAAAFKKAGSKPRRYGHKVAKGFVG